MQTDNELQVLATKFQALTQLSLRKCALLVGLSAPAFSDWVNGGVNEARTPQGQEAERRLRLVLAYEAATGGVRAANKDPAPRRFDMIMGVIEGAVT